jgi:hypothetical protein
MMKTMPTTNPTPAPAGPIHVAPGRRSVLRAGVAIGAASVTGVHAQSVPWPAKPVKIVSPYPAGGSNDAVARTLAAKLSDLWNQRVFVENKPGANNRIATQELARAAPDGYHLMLAAAPHGANPGLYDHKLPYDTLKDFVPIIRATVSPVGFWVPSASPFRTLDDMAKAARAQPGKPLIALVHEPRLWTMLPPNVDLVLAGHTHGGQIQIFGWPQFKKLDSQYLRGLFRNPGGQQMLVSAGIGTSIVPVRLGTQGEIVVVELQPPGRNSGTER